MAGQSTDKPEQSDNTPARRRRTPPARRSRRTGTLRLLDLIYEVLSSREMTNNAMKLVFVLSVFLVIPLAAVGVVLAVQHQEFAAVASMSTAGAALLGSVISLVLGRRWGGGPPPNEGPG